MPSKLGKDLLEPFGRFYSPDKAALALRSVFSSVPSLYSFHVLSSFHFVSYPVEMDAKLQDQQRQYCEPEAVMMSESENRSCRNDERI